MTEYDVPNVDGVPEGVLKTASALADTTTTVSESSISSSSDDATWGIYVGGEIAIEADSIISWSIRNDASVSDYLMESGAFSQYNKVRTPYTIKVQLTRNGGEDGREELIATLEDYLDSTDLLDIIIPEKTYTDVNLVKYEISRSGQDGTVNRIVADMDFIEIRETGTTEFTSTSDSSGSSSVSDGTVQAITADSAATTSATAAVSVDNTVEDWALGS